ncbi:rngB [Symbiodinium sp. CCMP2592]|nr:rngB [Symbiodinium sp. CCMP2592]
MSRWFQHSCSKSPFHFILCALQLAALVSANEWTLLSPSGTPAARSGHTMVWDPGADDGGFWMFGGELFLTIKSNHLYFYNPATNLWTQKASGPAARYRHSAVLDPTARTMYIFAGTNLASAGNTFNDLHRYDVQLDSWTELTGTAGRSSHTAVWDGTSDRMIVFGGSDNMLNKLGSLAEYDRATDSWSSPVAVGPAARDGHVAVWDPAAGSMLMCCGASSGTTLGDLWSYNGAWSQLAPSGSITARSYASAVWDPQAGALLGFAGSGGSRLNSLFLYSASANSWSEFTETGPPAQDRGAAAWDPVNGRLYVRCISYSHGQHHSDGQRNDDSKCFQHVHDAIHHHTKHGFINHNLDCCHFRDNLFHNVNILLYNIDDSHCNNIHINQVNFNICDVFVHNSQVIYDICDVNFIHNIQINCNICDINQVKYKICDVNLVHSNNVKFLCQHDFLVGDYILHSLEEHHIHRDPQNRSTHIKVLDNDHHGHVDNFCVDVRHSDRNFDFDVIYHCHRHINFVARQLVAQLGNSSNSSGILGSLLTQSDLATTQTLALDSVTIFGQSRNITVLSENATVDVPSEVVAQAAASVGGSGLVLLSISVGSSELRGGFDGTNEAAQGGGVAGDGPSLVSGSRPVSIAFRKPDGQRIPMPSLAQPIEIRLPGASEEAQCAFWDEETSAWSSKGLLRLAHEDGELICQTSHLTVFGAVLDVLLQVIRCSTASQVLSAEGFANFGKGTWTGRSPTVIAFIAVFVFVLLLLYALRLDAKRALSREEVEAALLVELEEDTPHEFDDSDDQEPEVKQAHRPNICQRAAAWMLSRFMWFLSQIFEMPDANMLEELMNAKVVTINRCISSIYAYKSHADRQSIRASETAVGHARMRPSNVAGVSVTVVDFVRMDMATTKENSKTSAVKEFLQSYWCKRVVLLMRAMHPWITMQYVSLFRSHVVRASLITLKLVSTGAANALFFAASAVSADSEKDCGPPETFGERLLRAGVVGILSACMGDLLILLLAAVQWRQVIVRHWTEETKERQLRSWRCRRCFFWLLWTLDTGMSILYIFGFLANVSEKDASKWLESTGISLLQDLLLKPLYMALLYGTVATMVLCCSPSVENEIVGQWIQGDEDDASRDDAQTRPESHALRPVCECDTDEIHEIYIDTVPLNAVSAVKLVFGRGGLVQGRKFRASDFALPGITKEASAPGPY